MIYGYVRVSTEKQETEAQVDTIRTVAKERHPGEPITFVRETISSRVQLEKRKFYNEVLIKAKKNDIIIVTEFSRIGRSMLEVMGILSDIMEKGVRLYVTKANLDFADNLQSKVIAFAFSLAAEIERELISSRTKEALALRKREGVVLGHKKGVPYKHGRKLDGLDKYILADLKKGYTKGAIARNYGISRMGLYRYMMTKGIEDPWAKKELPPRMENPYLPRNGGQ